MLQGTKLTMIGLANNASPGVDPGIHLRWSFDAALSFPKYGFEVYRRDVAQINCQPTCVDFLKISLATGATSFTFGTVTVSSSTAIMKGAGTTGATAILQSVAGTYTIKNTKKVREFFVSEYHAAGTLTVQAYDGATLVKQVTRAASASAGTVSIKADRFDKIVIKCSPAAKIELYQICWLLVTDCADGDEWVKLASLRLPKNWNEAKSRIPSTVHAQYSATYPRLEKVINWVLAGSIGEQSVTQVGAPAAQT